MNFLAKKKYERCCKSHDYWAKENNIYGKF
jgi:hypothetical protein